MKRGHGWKSIIPTSLRKGARDLGNRIPFEIRRRHPRLKWSGDGERFSYQQRLVDFRIGAEDKVLDIGSGSYPFPHADVLVDRYLEPSKHRKQEFVRDGKPVVLADVCFLPFRDKSFEYVVCSHLLEHVDDPIAACAEIMRVGRRGYIEAPSFTKDILFAWAGEGHRWYLIAAGSALCFFEYSQRQREGIRDSAWRDFIYSRWHHPLQKVFFENPELFNVIFPWTGCFSVYVFRLDGGVETLNAKRGRLDPSLPSREDEADV